MEFDQFNYLTFNFHDRLVMFVIVLFVDCNSQVIKETKDWTKDWNERIIEMEYKVGGMLQTLQDVNKIPQIEVDIETLYSIMRKKSEEINNLQSGLFSNSIQLLF